jgi:hypothetical protein
MVSIDIRSSEIGTGQSCASNTGFIQFFQHDSNVEIVSRSNLPWTSLVPAASKNASIEEAL